MKKSILCFSVFFAFSLGLYAQDNGNAGLGVIVNHHGERNFVPGPVSRDALDAIIQAGIRAPSANNRQPWRFTVVQSQSLVRRIVPAAVDGNVLIIISAPGDGRTNGREILDCGLAVESMYLAAQALGLGSRIYTGPIDAVNSQLKSELGLPRDHSAVVLLRVGRAVVPVDAASAASPRRAADETVSYK
jgi:nitroreductase